MKMESSFNVPDIVCNGCANGIRQALGGVDGIDRVDVDVESKTVTVEHADAVSRERIAELLDEAGFPAA